MYRAFFSKRQLLLADGTHGDAAASHGVDGLTGTGQENITFLERVRLSSAQR